MAEAFLFVPTLAFVWMWGFAFSIMLAHCFLIVFEDTAAGASQITWRSEAIADYFWKIFWLALMVFTWGLPGVILAMLAIKTESVPKLVEGLLLFWLLFPIGILSSLTGRSPWMPISLDLLSRLPQKFFSLIAFYILGAVPLAAFFSWLVFGVGRDAGIARIIPISALAAAGWIVYARLAGRYGFLLTFTKGYEVLDDRIELREIEYSGKRRKKKKKKKVEPEVPQEAPPFIQPSQMTPLTGAIDGPVVGYDVTWETVKPVSPPEKKPPSEPKYWKSNYGTELSDWDGELPAIPEEEPVREKTKGDKRVKGEILKEPTPWKDDVPLELPVRKRKVDLTAEEAEELGLKLSDVEPTPEIIEPVKSVVSKRKEPSEAEVMMYSKTRRPQAPAKAFDHSIVTVLFQVAAIKMWILLFLGMFVLAGAAQMLRFLRPGGGGLG